jgi:DNA-binding transcriptional LysR family regulator
VRAVAREAGLEPSSVSRRLTKLEARLGAKLLDRAQAKTRPTDAGQRFYDKMRVLLAQIDALEADQPRGLLKVDASIDFGQHHVAKWLFAFREIYAEVEIELTLSSRHVDVVASGIDLAIRVGQQADSTLMSRKLAEVPRVLVASPAYLKRRGMPETPDALAAHDHIFFFPESRRRPLRLTGPDGRVHKIDRQGGVTVNAIYSVVDAVKQGFGIHAGPRWAFQEALDRGEVVELLPDYAQDAMPMHAVWAPAVFVPARIRAFVDFAAKQVRTVPGLV